MSGSYSPGLRLDGWNNGNHWAVAHRCDRCGLVEYTLYDGEDGNLQCQKKPDGWEPHGGMTLCSSCAKSFRQWKEME